MDKKQIYIKRAIACFLAALLFLSTAAFGAGAAVAETVEKRTVRVGYFQADGYQEMDEENTRYGYGFDFLQMLLRYNDWSYEYVGFDLNWGDMLGMLERGEVDLVTLANQTPERMELFDYSTKPIGTSSTVMTISSRNTAIQSEKYSTYQNARVGLVTGSSHNAGFESYAAEKGFSYTPVYYEDIADLLADLRAGQNIDIAVTSNMRQLSEETVIDTFNATDYYAIVKKGNEALLDGLNNGIAQLDIYTPDWRNTLYKKYYADSANGTIFLSSSEQEYLQELAASGRVLKAAMNPELAPYSYFENGTAKGIVPAIFEIAAQRLGVAYEILPAADRMEYKQQLQSGQADIDLTAYLDYSIAQKYNLMETDAYMTTMLAMLYRKDSDLSPESMTIATVPDATEFAGYNKLLLVNHNCVEYDSLQACVEAVQKGQADVVYCYVYSAEQAAQQDYRNILQCRILSDYSFGLALGVNNQADHRLLSVFSKGVNSVGTAQRQSIMLRESAVTQTEQSLMAVLYTHPVGAACVLVVILLVACLCVVLWIRNRSQHQLLAAKSEFLARVSHDMRTPMNVILGLASMTMDDAENPPVVRENMTKLRSASDFLLGLVNDILDMTRIEQGGVHLHPEPYAYSEFVSIMELMFQAECDRKEITLTIQRPDKNPSVMADKTRLNQIFFNLFSNAVKYTKPGGKIIFRYQNDHVENGRFYCDYVLTDTGIGMSEEFQKRLFEPFAQEDSRVTPELQGCGLGLSITKRLVELMGGSIRVESKKNVGTTVFVSLSYELVNLNQQRTETAQDAPLALYQKLRGQCVLLAEDHPLNAQIAKRMLEKLGVTVIHAENGRVALEKFKGSPEGFIDAILMDIRMPEMDGLEATRAIRALPRADAAAVPIIAVSANAYDVDVRQSKQAGMNEHLAKPIDPKSLCQVLEKYLKEKENAAGAQARQAWAEAPIVPEKSGAAQDPLLCRMESMGAEVEDTLERLMGDENMYVEYLRKLPEDKNMELLRSAVAQKDYKGAERAVHALKGVALNLGLLPLVDSCMDMLLCFREGKPEQACAMLPAVERCFTQWTTAIMAEEPTGLSETRLES